MSQDFSWVKSALQYLQIYKEITGQSTDLTETETEKLAILMQRSQLSSSHGERL
jgi:starch synthase